MCRRTSRCRSHAALRASAASAALRAREENAARCARRFPSARKSKWAAEGRLCTLVCVVARHGAGRTPHSARAQRALGFSPVRERRTPRGRQCHSNAALRVRLKSWLIVCDCVAPTIASASTRFLHGNSFPQRFVRDYSWSLSKIKVPPQAHEEGRATNCFAQPPRVLALHLNGKLITTARSSRVSFSAAHAKR